MNFPQLPATFAVIAARAGGHYIGPDMFPAQVFWQHMVHRQIAGVASTVLAGEVVTAKDLPAGQFDLQARAMDHLLQDLKSVV